MFPPVTLTVSLHTWLLRTRMLKQHLWWKWVQSANTTSHIWYRRPTKLFAPWQGEQWHGMWYTWALPLRLSFHLVDLNIFMPGHIYGLLATDINDFMSLADFFLFYSNSNKVSQEYRNGQGCYGHIWPICHWVFLQYVTLDLIKHQ